MAKIVRDYWTVAREADTTGAANAGVAGAVVAVVVVLAAGVVAGVVVVEAVAPGCCVGITRRWPYWTFLASVMLFALSRSSVLMPYFFAIVAGYSLKSTMWIVCPFSV